MLFQQNKVKILRRHSRHHRSAIPLLRQQQGIVIVVALFFVALVAAIAYYMTGRLDRDTERTSLLLNNAQAEYYSRGSIAWAILTLRDNYNKQQPNKLIDVLPIRSAVSVVNGYRIQSTIYDMQARYNINNLKYPAAIPDFTRLLQSVVKDISEDNAKNLAAAVSDWVSIPQGNLADYYGHLPSPYTSPHRPMTSITELQLVKGITPELFALLRPYVTALPIPTPINVQTALAPVLTTLDASITPDKAKALEQLRAQNPFVSIQVFQNLDIIKGTQIVSDKYTVNSSFFLIETTVSKGEQSVVIYTLLERTSFQNKTYVTILWESKGIW